jgi:hypothetical protein
LADWVGGGVASATGAITDYDTQVASLARRLERNGGTDVLSMVMPTTATLVGADDGYTEQARRIIHDTAVSTEGAVTRELASVLRTSDGSFEHDGWWTFQRWRHNASTHVALDLLTTAAQSRQHPFRSELAERILNITTRDAYEHFVREELPVIGRRQHERAVADVQREAVGWNPNDNSEATQRRLAGMLHSLGTSADLLEAVAAVPQQAITGISSAHVDAMMAGVATGEVPHAAAAQVLLARGNLERYAEVYRTATPNAAQRAVAADMVARALPPGAAPGLGPASREGEEDWLTAYRGVLSLSRALGDDEAAHAALRRQVQQRIVQNGPGRLCELLGWTAEHGTPDEQRELARLIADASFWDRNPWGEGIRESLRLATIPVGYGPIMERLQRAMGGLG